MSLPQDKWGELSQYHRWALEILNKAPGGEVVPEGPASMKSAMHDLWRFGFAARKFNPIRYSVTFLGRRAAQEIKITTPST